MIGLLLIKILIAYKCVLPKVLPSILLQTASRCMHGFGIRRLQYSMPSPKLASSLSHWNIPTTPNKVLVLHFFLS